VSDVIHGVSQRIHLGHLLVLCRCWDLIAKDFETTIDLFDTISLTGVSSRHFGSNRRWNGITQSGMQGHFTFRPSTGTSSSMQAHFPLGMSCKTFWSNGLHLWHGGQQWGRGQGKSKPWKNLCKMKYEEWHLNYLLFWSNWLAIFFNVIDFSFNALFISKHNKKALFYSLNVETVVVIFFVTKFSRRKSRYFFITARSLRRPGGNWEDQHIFCDENASRKTLFILSHSLCCNPVNLPPPSHANSRDSNRSKLARLPLEWNGLRVAEPLETVVTPPPPPMNLCQRNATAK